MAKSRRIYLSAAEEPETGSPSSGPTPEFVPTAKLITFLRADSLLEVAALKNVPLYQLLEVFDERAA